MEPTSRPARYVTLRDYLRVLRRHRIAIVLIAAVGAGAGLLDAKRQTPTYEATATVAFQDPTQNLPLVGLGTGLIQMPSALAAQTAETLTAPQVMTRVRHNLKTTIPTRTLSSQVSSQVSTAGLLQINASSTKPAFAAALANAVADVVVGHNNRQTKANFASEAGAVRGQIRRIRTHPKGSPEAARLPVYESELARLDTLTQFAQSAQLEQAAQPPTSPISPQTLRSTILGLVLGLGLAVALAYIRDAMDRRLRSPQDIEAAFHLPILGHVRNQVMGQVAQIASNSSDDYKVDLEAFRIMRQNIQFLSVDSPPRSIVVTSAVPEEGKTTVAGSLAFAMTAIGKRTLLVDCDLRRPALGSRLDVESSPGLTDYLAGEATRGQILRRIAFTEAPSRNGASSATGLNPEDSSHGLVFIPAGSPTSHAAELLGSRRFKEMVEQVVETYDVVIFDTSPLLPVADTLEMVPYVDAVVICVRASKTKREEALAVKAALSRFPERPTGVVITGVNPNHDDYEVYEYSYGYG
jgi:Mrp family chromosome partitioning ATPase